MTSPALAIPLLRAAAWFGEDPLDPLLAPGADGWLDLAFGEPDVAFVERMQRRRLSPLARGCFHCAIQVQAATAISIQLLFLIEAAGQYCDHDAILHALAFHGAYLEVAMV